MTTLTEGKRLGDLVRFEEDARFSREVVTIKAGANLDVGAVLGIFTSTGDVGKYLLSAPAAENGTQTPVAVLAEPAAAASADVQAVVIRRHAKVNRSALVFHSSIDDATKRNAAVAALRAAGIFAD